MMVIKKSEIRKALQDWRRMEERTCKTNMATYESPELTARFIKRIAFMIGCPKGPETVKVLRPYIKQFKEEGII
ncbi:hypothetical protein [Clostridium phage XP41-N3]|nr:hypothetical protein [Clostridium phage XP41-N3]